MSDQIKTYPDIFYVDTSTPWSISKIVETDEWTLGDNWRKFLQSGSCGYFPSSKHKSYFLSFDDVRTKAVQLQEWNIQYLKDKLVNAEKKLETIKARTKETRTVVKNGYRLTPVSAKRAK